MTQYEEDLIKVERHAWIIEHINQTPEFYLEAVRQNNYLAFRYVKNQTLEICLEAIKNNYENIFYVKKQTPELYDYLLDNGILIIEKYINIPIETLSEKVQLYLKLV